MANIFRSRSAAQLLAHLENWYKCLDAVAAGQSYSVTSGGITRVMTKANMAEVMETIDMLETAYEHKNGTAVTRTHVKIV